MLMPVQPCGDHGASKLRSFRPSASTGSTVRASGASQTSRAAVARAIGVTPARLNDIVNEKRSITADTALRLGRYFGSTAEVWINLQKRYELEMARRELGSTLASIRPRAA